MLSTRAFLFAMLTLAAVFVTSIQTRSSTGLHPLAATIIVVTSASIGSTSIVFLERKRLGFRFFLKDNTIDGTQTTNLLGIKRITFRENYVLVEDENGRKIAHAFLRIRDIPYLIDDLDQSKKMLYVGNFVRLLATLSFPFELIPRVIPVSAEAYLKRVGKEIEDQRLLASSEGKQASPGREARIERLQRVYERLAKGERAKDVGFLAHILLDGNEENQILSQLETNVKTLSSTLEFSLGIKAERLRGYAMVEAVREFFRASCVVWPSKSFRVLTWDLAYLIPLTKPKLPPIDKLLNGVYIGRTHAGMPVCFDLNSYSNPHGCSVGLSGTGKSTFLKTMLVRHHDLEQVPILIIDYAGEYRDWVLSRQGTLVDMQRDTINPFELGAASLSDRVRQVVDSFHHICDFKTINQRNAFAHYVMRAYRERGFKPSDRQTWNSEPPTLQDIIQLMEKELDSLRPMKQLTVVTLIDRLQALASGPFGIFGKSTVSISALTQGFVCIDLSRVTSITLKDLVAWTILQYIDSMMRLEGTKEKVRLIVALDEAWKLCRSESSLPVTIIKEGRKYGYSLWVASQDATADLAESILANAGTVVIFRTQHPRYLNFFKSAYGLNEQEVSRVQNLAVGEALVKLSDDPRPFFVKVEMEEVEHRIIESEPKPIISDNQSQVLPPSPQIEKSLPALASEYDGLSVVERKTLEVVAGSRILTITELYSQLGTSTYHANKSKRELISKRLIVAVSLPRLSGKGRSPQTLVLTDEGAKTASTLGIKVSDLHKTRTLQHQYIVQWLVDEFEKEGWKTTPEYDIGKGKRVDILVNEKIAVEVERGKSDIVENVKKNRQAGLEVIIVTTGEAIASVKDKLALSGLDAPVVLSDQVVSRLRATLGQAPHGLEVKA